MQVFTLVGPRAILGKERLCTVRWKCRFSPWLGPGQYCRTSLYSAMEVQVFTLVGFHGDTGLRTSLRSAMEVQVFTLVGPRAILDKERLCAVRWKCRSSSWLGPRVILGIEHLCAVRWKCRSSPWGPGQYWVKNVFVQCDGSAGLHPVWA